VLGAEQTGQDITDRAIGRLIDRLTSELRLYVPCDTELIISETFFLYQSLGSILKN